MSLSVEGSSHKITAGDDFKSILEFIYHSLNTIMDCATGIRFETTYPRPGQKRGFQTSSVAWMAIRSFRSVK